MKKVLFYSHYEMERNKKFKFLQKHPQVNFYHYIDPFQNPKSKRYNKDTSNEDIRMWGWMPDNRKGFIYNAIKRYKPDILLIHPGLYLQREVVLELPDRYPQIKIAVLCGDKGDYDQPKKETVEIFFEFETEKIINFIFS